MEKQKTIVKFTGKHRREMIDPAHAKEIQETIAELHLPEQTKYEMSQSVSRNTAPENKWTFIMLSPHQHAAVVDWIFENSKRPNEAMRLWAKLFTVARMDTGEILMTRDEMADAIQTEPRHVSTIMSELASINAISRRRQRVAGMRGPGQVHYYMNPNVATGITGINRDKAQEEAGQLNIFDVIKGGKSD